MFRDGAALAALSELHGWWRWSAIRSGNAQPILPLPFSAWYWRGGRPTVFLNVRMKLE